MANSVVMDFPLPIPNTTDDLTASEMIVNALEVIDGHDHNSVGSEIPSSAINWNDNVDFNSQQLLDLGSIQLENKLSNMIEDYDIRKLYVVNGNLFYRNNDAQSIQITSGNSVNVSSVGSITGMTEPAASVTYGEGIETFTFKGDNSVNYASLVANGFLFSHNTNNQAVTVKPSESMDTGYDIILPSSKPSHETLLRCSTSGLLEPVEIRGTSNQITVAHSTGYITLSLPTAITTTTINANIVNETTSDAGVTVDGLLIKDGNLASGIVPVANGGTGVTTSTGTGNNVLSTSPTLTTPLLGTPTSGNLANCTSLPIVGGTTGTLSVARGGTGVTSSTGSGSVVLSSSPTIDSLNTSGDLTGVITSGSYTPTQSFNIGSAYSSTESCHYVRVGTRVTVYGRCYGRFSSGSAIDFTLTLPIATSATLSSSCGSISSCPNTVTGSDNTIPPSSVRFANDSNSNVRIKGIEHYGSSYSYGTHAHVFHFSFTYRIT